MITLFSIFLIVFIAKIAWFAIKAAWGIGKFVLGIILFPLFLIALVAGGLIYIALPLLIIAGVISLFTTRLA